MPTKRTNLPVIGCAAIVFTLAALLYIFFGYGGLFVSPELYLIIGGVTFVVAAFLWWLMLRVAPGINLWHSAVFGFLIALLVYPFAWLLILLFYDLSGSLLEALNNVGLLEGLVIVPILTLISWIFLGWTLLPLGALVGAGVAWVATRGMAAPQASTAQILDAYTKYLPAARRVFAGIGIALLAVFGVLFLMACLPVSTAGLDARPNPAPDYATALARFEQLNAAEKSEPWLEVCRTRLLTHGVKTARSIILLHGYTNCPRQFWELGDMFYQRGYNVLIARMPQHVNVDFNAAHLNQLTAEQLRDYGDTAMDLAAGLGDQVYVMGLSGGGAVVGWIAQYRPDAARVMLLAPFFALKMAPNFMNLPLMRLGMHLPPLSFSGTPRLDHGYPGNSTRGLAEFLRFGEAVRQTALLQPPLVKSILLVTIENDLVVDNDYARAVMALWRAHGATIDEFEFDAKYGLAHDMIDVSQRDQPIEWTYPALIDLMEGRTPTLP